MNTAVIYSEITYIDGEAGSMFFYFVRFILYQFFAYLFLQYCDTGLLNILDLLV